MARRQVVGLRRVLGVYPLASSAYGNVGSSIYYALGLVAALALGLTPVVFIISGFVFFLTASTYTEATTMFPEAGGSSSFARHAFNEFWSFFAAWGQMLNYTFTVAISAYFVPHYIGGLFWSALRHPPGDVIGGILVVVVLALINVRGIEESTGVNVVLALVDFGTQLLLVVLGLFLVFSPHQLIANVHLGIAPTWKNFLIAIPLCMLAYTGIETISNMSEEAKDPASTVPKAMNRVVLAVFAIYSLLPMIALSALPVERHANGSYSTKLGVGESHGGYAADPVLGVVRQLHLGFLQSPAEIYVGILAATILIIATNAGMIGVSRLVYSMGIHRQLPNGLRRLHPRYGTPWIGILLFGLLACLALAPGKAEFLGNMYAFGAMLSFTIAHASVVRMRKTLPDHERPYRGPGNVRLAGVEVPVFAVVGGLATFVSLCVITALHIAVAGAGIGWLLIGVLTYALYRRRQGLDLTRTVSVALPASVVERDIEYRSVLIAVNERLSPDVLATASKLAARRQRAIHVLVIMTVPTALPLDAILYEQEMTSLSILEEARIRGGRRITGGVIRVRPGQEGRAIVEHAKEIGAEAIVMPLQVGRPDPFQRVHQQVLSARPCRVILQTERPELSVGEPPLAAAT
jgi:basic amino acid/polyamine antiporter, APA family